jgi:hypothetical protein
MKAVPVIKTAGIQPLLCIQKCSKYSKIRRVGGEASISNICFKKISKSSILPMLQRFTMSLALLFVIKYAVANTV